MKTAALAFEQIAERVRGVIDSWRAGSQPDARVAMDDIPGIDQYPSLAVDLAYEEFCLHEEAGGPLPSVGVFCNRFGPIRSVLRNVLEGHRVLAAQPDLLAGPAWPAPGDCWDDHLVFVRELGRGAFARAYLVADSAIGRRIVVKLSRRVSGEGQSLGSVKHPHVADVLWSRPAGGFHAVAMPYEGSATLRQVIDAGFSGKSQPTRAATILRVAGQGEPPDAVRPAILTGSGRYADAVSLIAERVALALHHAAAQGLAHGDLKPANVVVAPGGHPLLIDFNLAAAAADPAGLVGGTLPYMAPERLRALLSPTPTAVDRPTADVYSFGVMLHETLTGRLPFGTDEAPSIREAAERELRRRAVPLPAALKNVPGVLTGLIRDCLAEAPGRRPSFQDVAARLARYRRRTWRRLLAAACALALLFFSAGAAYQLRDSPPPAPSPVAAAPTNDPVEIARRAIATGERTSAVLAHLLELEASRPDEGRTVATVAYLALRSGQEGMAIAKGNRAVHDLGFREPWALNNLAAALLKLSSDRKDWSQAIALTTEALAADSRCRAARYNRALAVFESARFYKKPLTDLRCVDDIEAVTTGEPKSAELFLDAARIFAAGGPVNVGKAIANARRAIEFGQPVQSILNHPDLIGLNRNQEFLALGKLQPGFAKPRTAEIRWFLPKPGQ